MSEEYPSDDPRSPDSTASQASGDERVPGPADPPPPTVTSPPVAPPPPPPARSAALERARGTRRHARPRKKHKKAPWWELPVLAAVAIAIAILVKTFLIQPFYIPSQSMEKTLHGCPGCSGDRILVNKPIYDLRDPHPGDIVVFHAPSGWEETPPTAPPGNPVLRVIRDFGQLVGVVPPDDLVLVKRVIATGGQAVKGTSDGSVWVADSPAGPFRKLNEAYVFRDGPDSHAQFGPVTVPKGRLWVMGDHRNDSADSRYHCDASGSGSNSGAGCNPVESTVPNTAVIGKAVLIAWPPSRWRTLGTPATFTHAALSGVPVAGGLALTVPFWLVRRRRR